MNVDDSALSFLAAKTSISRKRSRYVCHVDELELEVCPRPSSPLAWL